MEPKILELDLVDCAVMQWTAFWHTLETLAGPIDADIMEKLSDLATEPGGMYEIGRILEVDSALVLLAHGLSEGIAQFFSDQIHE